MRSLIQALVLLLVTTSMVGQELKLPSLSPSSTITQEFSTSKIEVTYSRPSMRGRKVFGELVPFGSVWRTGANAATKITFAEDVQIGGRTIKPGTYSLYTVPSATEFEVIINGATGSWIPGGFPKSEDVVRLTVPAKTLDRDVETLTLQFSNITYSSCTIDIMWERTMVSVPVLVSNQDRLVKAIDRAITNPNIPYQQAATYLYESGQELEKALEYAGKALERNPNAYWLAMLKARIAAKLGRNDVAREAANKTIELVRGTGAQAEYTKSAQDLINTLK
ncbi:MAG: hypothetical protein RL594_608 [Bacteroidota bacterium]|jgi:hypothetical protein